MPLYRYEYQVDLAQRILDVLSNKKTVLLSCPCGYGKSGVAYQLFDLNLQRNGTNSVILNHNKMLVDQYEDLMKGRPEVVCIKGKSNYFCALEQSIPCDEAKCEMYPKYNCLARERCEYYFLKSNFVEKPLAVTNYQFVLSNLDSETYKRENNSLLICDECHNLDAIISSYRKTVVNSDLIELVTKVAAYMQKFNVKSIVREVSEILTIYSKINEYNYANMFSTIYDNISYIVEYFTNLEKPNKEYENLLITVNKLNRYLSRYKAYKKDSNTEYVYSGDVNETFEYSLTPLEIGYYFPEFLDSITYKSVLMSGTIVNPKYMIKNLGLNPDETVFMDIPSMFNKENRPILFCNIAPLNAGNTNLLSKEFQNIIDTVLGLLEVHRKKKESGVIFTPSYKLANDIYTAIERKATKLGYKIFMNKSAKDSSEVLDKYVNSKGLRLLISPSFEEGVNFKGDISRFQIICKTPYLYLGDARTKLKCETDKTWYESITFCRIIQSASRSVRDKDDYAVTYILDSNATRLYNKVKQHCPGWFNEAVEIL